jgi:hypothetical protein
MQLSIRCVIVGLIGLGVLLVDVWAIQRNVVQPRGTSFDFYLVWRGVLEFGRGGNPYTENVAQQIQQGILGHLAAPNENQYYFVYPAYLALLLLPIACLPFYEAVTLWLVLQQIFLVVAFGLLLHALDWLPARIEMLVLITLWIVLRYTWITLILAQTSIAILTLLALVVYALKRGALILSAIALVLMTIKPQLAFLPTLGWLGMMVAQRQWHALSIFGFAYLTMFIAPFFVLGNWLGDWIHTLTLYVGYNRTHTPLTWLASFLVEPLASALVAVGVALGLGYLLWLARHSTNGIMLLSFGILLTLLIVPLPSVYDLVLALFPWLVCWYALQGLWSMRLLLAALPLVSWAMITLVPAALEFWGWNFDVVMADKLLMSVPLLMALIYAQYYTRDGANGKAVSK